MPDDLRVQGPRPGRAGSSRARSRPTTQTLVVGKLRQMGYMPIAIEQQKSAQSLSSDIKIPGFAAEGQAQGRRGLLAPVRDDDQLRPLADPRAAHPRRADREQAARRDRRPRSASTSRGARRSRRRWPATRRCSTASTSRWCKAGEAGGVLDAVLLALADTIEKQVELRRKVKSAMTYPIVVLVPRARSSSTAMLLLRRPDVQGALRRPRRHAAAADPGPDLRLGPREASSSRSSSSSASPASSAFRKWIKTEHGPAEAGTRSSCRCPVFGKLVHKTALARFSRTLVGARCARACRSSSRSTSSPRRSATTSCRTAVARHPGARSSAATRSPRRSTQHEVFPPMVVQMMAVGEETGALDEMLDKIADFYDQEVEATVDALTSLIEPLLIVVMGGDRRRHGHLPLHADVQHHQPGQVAASASFLAGLLKSRPECAVGAVASRCS